jgi:hypothetical protein
MSVRAFRAVARIVAGLPLIVFSPAAHAQDPTPEKWTFEVYGGGNGSIGSLGGAFSATFPPGAAFTTASGRPSRAVSSWYFGDGAALLNQVLTQFASAANSTFPRVTPLETALSAGALQRDKGFSIGLRLGRTISRRLVLEMDVEQTFTRLSLSENGRSGFTATSESYIAALRGLLNSAPVTTPVVTSVLDEPDTSSGQTRLMGALRFAALSGDRFDLHLVGGAGVAISTGAVPSATLTGKYSFRYFGLSPMEETDVVNVRFSSPRTSGLGMVGGGATYGFSNRSGIRADVRLLFGSRRQDLTITATPTIAALTPTAVMSTAANISPGLQFSTQAGIRSSLGDPTTPVTTSAGSGSFRQASFTFGFYRRF